MSLAIYKFTRFIIISLLSLSIAQFAHSSTENLDSISQASAPSVENEINSGNFVSSYVLGSGDRLRITVFGEEDLSGEFDIDGEGILAFPLIGSINTNKLNVRSLEDLLVKKLQEEYLVNPRVAIEVLNFRPFFILGEVNKPGSYPYVSGLTVVNAVALAGGYTYRAKTSKVKIIRDKIEMAVGDDFLVMPGDSIRVSERFF